MKKAICILCGALLASSLVFNGCTNSASPRESILSEEITGEITVSCYDSMVYKGFLEEAAKAFEAKYSGVAVTVEAFGAMPEIKTSGDGKMAAVRITESNDDQAADDYISKISTELMSGGGADILAMDVLPYYQYAENGQLVDLAPLMEEDESFDLSDYRENIIRASAYQGGQYLLPLDYVFQYFAYDSSLFSPDQQQALQSSDAFTYNDLVEIAKVPFAEKSNKMFGLSSDVNRAPNMLSELLTEDYASYIDVENKTASLDDGRFAQLLETVKKYEEEGYIGLGDKGDTGMSTSSFGIDQSERYFYKPKNSFNLLSHFNQPVDGKPNMVVSTGINSGNEKDDEIAGIAANSEGEAAFTYQQAYGLNANSANKRTAWEFIKFMLSEDMQTSPQLSLLSSPVHNDARRSKAEMLLTGEFRPQMPAGVRLPAGADADEPTGSAADEPASNAADEGVRSDSDESPNSNQSSGQPADQLPSRALSDEEALALERYLTQSEAFADMLNRYVIRDKKIDAMITAEAKNFFDGTKSAQEAAKALQSKVELYLNE